MSLSSIIKVVKTINFGTLYIKPAFLFQDGDGAIKLQFEADASSALGYLYDNLCKMLGLTWNYDSPSNDYGAYTNCAMHASGDRAAYGCGPDNANTGGFCPQMTVAYRVAFQSENAAASFMARGNVYVDYWRSLYPTGVAVGTGNFCKNGGCLGLFLNRYDLYQVFKPELGGSWVEYNGATFAPTISPAPTADGGCDNAHNSHLDKCVKMNFKNKAGSVAWASLGPIGQLSIFLVTFMAVTLSASIFLARARKRRRRGESYLRFLVRDVAAAGKKKRKKLRKKRRTKNRDLEEDMLAGRPPRSSGGSRSKSKSRGGSSRSKSRERRHGEGSSSRHRSSSKGPRDEEGASSSRHRSSSKGPRDEEGGSRRSSSKHRSSSSKRREGEGGGEGEGRSRGSSRRRSSSKGGEEKSGRRSSRSRSRSRREGGAAASAPDNDDMSRRQLV